MPANQRRELANDMPFNIGPMELLVLLVMLLVVGLVIALVVRAISR